MTLANWITEVCALGWFYGLLGYLAHELLLERWYQRDVLGFCQQGKKRQG